MHLAMLYSAIKEIAHGCVQPWGPRPVILTKRSDYGVIWERWPKREGLGIPGPAQWADYRTNKLFHMECFSNASLKFDSRD